MVHIGNKIKQVFEESRLQIKDFATKINKSRTVVYNIFERKTIDTGLLYKISKVLDHDFFTYYTSNDSLILKEDQAKYGKNKILTEQAEQLQAYKKEIASLKEKYELAVKINKLLEEKDKKSTKKNRPVK